MDILFALACFAVLCEIVVAIVSIWLVEKDSKRRIMKVIRSHE